jgi:hypothetical protein
MIKEDLNISDMELLDNLNLLVNEKLKRAAVMLFHRKPGRIAAGSCIKIGRFSERRSGPTIPRHCGRLPILYCGQSD